MLSENRNSGKYYEYLYLVSLLAILGFFLLRSPVYTEVVSARTYESVFEQIDKTTRELLNSDSEISLFANALNTANTLETLDESVSVLVFAPTNHGLRNQGSAFLLQDELLNEDNKARLVFQVESLIVKNPPVHITSGCFPNSRMFVKTLSDVKIPIRIMASNIIVGHDTFVTRIVKTTDGIVLFVDNLLLARMATAVQT